MGRPRIFGKQSRPQYTISKNPRTHQFVVQRIWGSGFGERLIIGSFPTKGEAQAVVRKRQRGLG